MPNYKKHFSIQEIQVLQNDPRVKYVVDEFKIRLTLDFLLEIYEAVKDHLSGSAIRAYLRDAWFSGRIISSKVTDNLYQNMKNSRPMNSNGLSVKREHADEDDQWLLSTGSFVRRNRITFSDELVSSLFHPYPETSIEDGLRNAGIDSVRVGYQSLDNHVVFRFLPK